MIYEIDCCCAGYMTSLVKVYAHRSVLVMKPSSQYMKIEPGINDLCYRYSPTKSLVFKSI